MHQLGHGSRIQHPAFFVAAMSALTTPRGRLADRFVGHASWSVLLIRRKLVSLKLLLLLLFWLTLCSWKRQCFCWSCILLNLNDFNFWLILRFSCCSWCVLLGFYRFRFLLLCLGSLRRHAITSNDLRLNEQHLYLLPIYFSCLGVSNLVIVVCSHRVHRNQVCYSSLVDLPFFNLEF